MPTRGELDTSKPLPPKIEEAARIEALEGLTLTEIGKRLGIRRETISNYRKYHPAYLELRTEVARDLVEPLQTLKGLTQLETLKTFRKANEVVDRLLDYEVDGVPQTATQLEAARLSAILTKTVLGDVSNAEDKTTVQAVAAVVIHIERPDEEDEIIIENGEIVGG